MKCYECEYYGRECAVLSADLPACQDYKPKQKRARGRVVLSEEFYAARRRGQSTAIVAGNYIVYPSINH